MGAAVAVMIPFLWNNFLDEYQRQRKQRQRTQQFFHSPFSSIVFCPLRRESERFAGQSSKAIVNGKEYTIGEEKAETPKSETKTVASTGTGGVITAPMPGMVTQVLVAEGQAVKAGDTLVVVEVMKMETPIKATVAGMVKRLFVKKGDNIKTGDKVAEV